MSLVVGTIVGTDNAAGGGVGTNEKISVIGFGVGLLVGGGRGGVGISVI